MTMKTKLDERFTAALESIGTLLDRELNELQNAGWLDSVSAHFDIEHAPVNDKAARLYRYFIPLRRKLVLVLAENYRRCFKLALAHPSQTGRDPHEWVLSQLQPAILAVAEWIPGWYALACDGARPRATAEFVPGQTVSLPISMVLPPTSLPESWRAPAWLFEIGFAVTGIGPLKQKHVPERKSDDKLGVAHTRLLLKGARRMFLWDLGATIDTIKNEETAAAGAVPTHTARDDQNGKPEKRKHWQKGFEGLGSKKADLSRYTHVLTEKQEMAFSLRRE